jgi:putative FmdB family regulatory protein
MPLYEYECQSCGYRFEVIQRFSDPAVDACQKCGGSVRKLLSPPAIQFKGSGWYITDYARKDSKSSDAPSSPDKTKAAPSAAAADKSDSAAPAASSTPSQSTSS